MIIYRAINKLNGKIYIGKTINNLKYRKNSHKYDAKNKKTKTYFHKAIRKYGIENFEFIVLLKSCDEKSLNILEIYYIKSYQKLFDLYNLTDGGEGVGGHKHSEETIKKFSELNKGRTPWNKGMKNPFFITDEIRKKLSECKIGEKNHFYGKKHSRELKEKWSKERKGKPNYKLRGRKHSEEHKKKLSLAHMGQKSWNKGLTKNDHPALMKLSKERTGLGNPMYKAIVSEDTKKKLSKSNSGTNNSFYGKKHTAETIIKMINSKRKNKNKKLDSEGQGTLFE